MVLKELCGHHFYKEEEILSLRKSRKKVDSKDKKKDKDGDEKDDKKDKKKSKKEKDDDHEGDAHSEVVWVILHENAGGVIPCHVYEHTVEASKKVGEFVGVEVLRIVVVIEGIENYVRNAGLDT